MHFFSNPQCLLPILLENLRYQVRNMVGLLLYVGSGKKEVKEVPNIIDAKDRTKSVKTAPPEGLYLKKVWY